MRYRFDPHRVRVSMSKIQKSLVQEVMILPHFHQLTVVVTMMEAPHHSGFLIITVIGSVLPEVIQVIQVTGLQWKMLVKLTGDRPRHIVSSGLRHAPGVV